MVGPYPVLGERMTGGVEAVTYNIVEGFKSFQEIEITVLSFMKKRDEEVKLSNNITIKYFKTRFSNIKLDLLLFAKRTLYSEYKKNRYDIIHLQGNGSTLLLFDSRYKDKIVVTQHGVLSKERKLSNNFRQTANLFLAQCIEKITIKKIKNWIFISDYNKNINEELVNSGINWCQIYNPVNPMFFDVNSDVESNGVSLYYVGTISKLKGLLDLLDALAVLKQMNIKYKLDVIGGFLDDKYKMSIQKCINKNELTNNVHFHGWKKSIEIAEIAKQCNYFILPSHQECLPVVISEAMSMGKIVIATRVGGIPEMIEDGKTGYLYDSGNVEQLENIMKHIIFLDDSEKKVISGCAKLKAEKMFDPEQVVFKTIEFYKEIIINCNGHII